MRDVIRSDRELCVGCHRCARECPMEMANLTYLDETGQIKVRVDTDQCIACGACLLVCEHNARHFEDDLDAFLAALDAGEKVSLIVAPAVRANIPSWEHLFSWFREMGVSCIFDVSFGADICTWAHLRHMEQRPGTPLITQPCPAIVSYCEIQKHELLSSLSPIHSPMACAAIYMRNQLKIEGTIAALSPCIAKSNEFDSIGVVQLNITFAKLEQRLAERGVALPREKSGFDNIEAGLGKIYPLPGGLRENIEFFTGKAEYVDKSGPGVVYASLDEYAQTSSEFLPQIFDVLNCAEGCVVGPGCSRDKNLFELRRAMNVARDEALTRENAQRHRELFEAFDKTLTLADYYREYQAIPTKAREVSEEEIQDVFRVMDKDTFAKQNFNCGACGSNSCRDMARKIALGVTLPVNCVIKSRDDAEQGRQRNLEYIALVHDAGEMLLSADGKDSYSTAITGALRVLVETVKSDVGLLWRDGVAGDREASKIFTWFKNAEVSQTVSDAVWPEEWLEMLKEGKHVQERSESCPEVSFPEGIQSVLAVPMRLRDSFWGFLVIGGTNGKHFTEEEIFLVESIGVLIVSRIIEHELTETLIGAREEAFAGKLAKGEFLSRMSHEMRTPLNAIIGMAKIGARTADADKMRYCLSIVRGASEHLLALISDVLDMSKIEAGKLELEKAPFDLEKTLSNVCDIVLEKVEQKNQTLRIFIDSDLHLHYVGDSLRLAQVLTNLLGNAVKFTPDKGEITLRVKEISQREDVGVLRFAVSDTGIGVTEEQASRLFQAFEQAAAEISRTFGGTGLGLAISKNIVEKMNGRISVVSEPGKGATFSFDVELERCCGEALAPERRESALANVRILVVENDAIQSSYFVSLVQGFGMTADAVDSLVGAKVHIAESAGAPYSVVCFSLNMPDASPEETMRQLADEAAGIPIVAMASFMEWNKIETAAAAIGVARFIPKPLFPSPVLDVILSVLGETASVAGDDEGYANAENDARDFSDITILLAEDIAINREIFCTLLEDTNISIDIAEDGRQAVELFATAPDKYAMIVMDIQMPVMDGYEASVRIRRLDAPRAKTIPIIAMTANAFKEDVERGRECGMNSHLTKPIDEQALLETVTRYAVRMREGLFS